MAPLGLSPCEQRRERPLPEFTASAETLRQAKASHGCGLSKLILFMGVSEIRNTLFEGPYSKDLALSGTK